MNPYITTLFMGAAKTLLAIPFCWIPYQLIINALPNVWYYNFATASLCAFFATVIVVLCFDGKEHQPPEL